MVCVAIFDGFVAICRNFCCNFFSLFLFKNRDVFITWLEILLQLWQLFLVSRFTTESVAFPIILSCALKKGAVCYHFICSDIHVLFFYKHSWYVLQFSIGLWQFFAIPVAIIFRVFFKNRDVFITRLETLLQLSQLFLVCPFTTEWGTLSINQTCS